MCQFCNDLVELKIETVLEGLQILLATDITQFGIREAQQTCINNFYGYLVSTRSVLYADRVSHKPFNKFVNLIHNNTLLEAHWRVSPVEFQDCIIRSSENILTPEEKCCIKHPNFKIYPSTIAGFLSTKFPALFSFLK